MSTTSIQTPLHIPLTSPSPLLLISNPILVFRNIVFQLLDLILNLADLLLELRLAAVRGAFTGDDSLLGYEDDTAAVVGTTVAVEVDEETAFFVAGGGEDWRLGFAAAVEGVGVVVAHCWC